MKMLIIESCLQCPRFKCEPIEHEDNRYLAICTNHEENIAWRQRIGTDVEPPPSCPLQDFQDTLYS